MISINPIFIMKLKKKNKSAMFIYSRLRNKHTPTLINFWYFFQGLRSYYGLKRLKIYYLSLHILKGYVYSSCHIFQRLRLFKGLCLFRTLEQCAHHEQIKRLISTFRFGKPWQLKLQPKDAKFMIFLFHLANLYFIMSKKEKLCYQLFTNQKTFLWGLNYTRNLIIT